jgi:hypothetical protein
VGGAEVFTYDAATRWVVRESAGDEVTCFASSSLLKAKRLFMARKDIEKLKILYETVFHL